jgi:hypothetical protein
MNKKMLVIIPVAASVIGFIIITDTLAFNDTPWAGMTCEQMKDYALDPKHFKLTDNQHMKFHMAIDECSAED